PDTDATLRASHAEPVRTRDCLMLPHRLDTECLTPLLHRVLDAPRVIQVHVVFQEAPELQDLFADLAELRGNIQAPVHALDRAAAQPRDRSRGLDRQLPDLVFLVQPGLDLRYDLVELLHGARMPHPVSW